MKTLFLRLFRNVSGKGTISLNGKVFTFLFCLIVSAFFWLVTVLSKPYASYVSFSVNYLNIPDSKVVEDSLPTKISIGIKSSGFRLLLQKVRSSPQVINIDLSNIRLIKNSYCYITNDHILEIADQLDKGIKVVSIIPDTLFLGANSKTEKTVPIKLNINLRFEKQYQLSDSINFFPRKLTVSGTEAAISKIDHLETENIVLNSLKETTSLKALVKFPKGVKSNSIKNVTVSIPITHFTEGSVSVPLEVLNLPSFYNAKTYPSKVNVKFMVAYENFNKIDESMFKVIVDYAKVNKGSNLLKTEIKQYPTKYVQLKTIKINPEKVEYIVRKNG